MSLTLLAVLLGSLGFWYRQIYCLHKQQKNVYSSFMEEARAYQLLRILFREALTSAEDKDALLSLTFDRGVYKDPELAGEVRAAFHYDPEQYKLELRVYNLKNENKMEYLTLLSYVKYCSIASLEHPSDQALPEKVCIKIIRELPGQKTRTLNYLFALGK